LYQSSLSRLTTSSVLNGLLMMIGRITSSAGTRIDTLWLTSARMTLCGMPWSCWHTSGWRKFDTKRWAWSRLNSCKFPSASRRAEKLNFNRGSCTKSIVSDLSLASSAAVRL